MRDAPKYPVKFVDDFGDAGLTLGWIAMPVVPVVGDDVELPGMGAGKVRERRWVFDHPGDTYSMKDAGIDFQWRQWIAVIVLEAS